MAKRHVDTASGQRLAVIEFHIIEPIARTRSCKPSPSLRTKSLPVALTALSWRSEWRLR